MKNRILMTMKIPKTCLILGSIVVCLTIPAHGKRAPRIVKISLAPDAVAGEVSKSGSQGNGTPSNTKNPSNTKKSSGRKLATAKESVQVVTPTRQPLEVAFGGTASESEIEPLTAKQLQLRIKAEKKAREQRRRAAERSIASIDSTNDTESPVSAASKKSPSLDRLLHQYRKHFDADLDE